jgi:hypothetical protein
MLSVSITSASMEQLKADLKTASQAQINAVRPVVQRHAEAIKREIKSAYPPPRKVMRQTPMQKARQWRRLKPSLKSGLSIKYRGANNLAAQVIHKHPLAFIYNFGSGRLAASSTDRLPAGITPPSYNTNRAGQIAHPVMIPIAEQHRQPVLDAMAAALQQENSR